jgi:hypothetical protein
MTLHNHRRAPANGARRQRKRKGGETVAIVVRMDSPDFEPLKEVAERRGVPLASIIREACRDFILRGPVYEPRQP